VTQQKLNRITKAGYKKLLFPNAVQLYNFALFILKFVTFIQNALISIRRLKN